MRALLASVALGALTAASGAGAQTTYSNSYPGQYPPGYNNGYNNGYNGQTIDCRSSGYNFTRCNVPWRDAQIVQQYSSSACVRGQTWGVDNGGLWVNKGCAARFAPVGYGGGGGWQPGPDWNRQIVLGCGSPQHRYAFCQIDVGRRGRVFLQRQTSHSRCVEGQTWGWNRAGIWVDRGCGGQFVVDRRW